MAITAYVGLPGHGKSYGVVENVIIPALKQGRDVYTNIPVKQEQFVARYNVTPTVFDLQDIIDNDQWFQAVFSAGGVLVLDELWRLWPAGLQADKVPEPHKAFLAMHRHLKSDEGAETQIVFVTQNLQQIAKFARDLVEESFRVEKAIALGSKKKYRVDVYPGAIKEPPNKKQRKTDFHGFFKQEIFELYQSHTMSAESATDSTKVDERGNILKGWVLRAMVVSIAVLAILFFYGISEVIGYFSSGGQAVSATSAPVTPAERSQARRPAPDHVPFLSEVRSITVGMMVNYDQRFDIQGAEGQRVNLTFRQLQSLGYSGRRVAQCLWEIKGHDYNGMVMCGDPYMEFSGSASPHIDVSEAIGF